ncbi:MAG: ABC transporter ATP-binding protein [Thalassobaculales bacterium]
MTPPLLEIENLSAAFPGLRGPVVVLDQVSLTLGDGEVLGVVGESGSGKSMLALAAMGLLPPPGRRTAGSIRLAGTELTGLSAAEMRKRRGREMAMIFQEPMTSLNPVLPVGRQIAEPLWYHQGLRGPAARARAIELLKLVEIPNAERRVDDYPHQLSGGQRQRVMIAIALACSPRLLIADEPTTALDVTIQAQILDLLRQLQGELGMSVLLITHDMGVIAEFVDRVMVMYAGRVVESAPVRAAFRTPAHPYTAGLLSSVPAIDHAEPRLATIPGSVPSPYDLPPGCAFAPRCGRAQGDCAAAVPRLAARGPGHMAACLHPLPGEVAP